jgi:hypothetical protein
MKHISVFLIVFVFFGCKRNEDLAEDFRNVIIDYQKQYPIREKSEKIKKIFIYSVYFEMSHMDTLLKITRTSSGIDDIIFKKSGGYGIYEDDVLKPTLLFDSENLGNKFILKKIRKIDKKYYNQSPVFDEGFTPIHIYKIHQNHIKFISADTVWKHWD